MVTGQHHAGLAWTRGVGLPLQRAGSRLGCRGAASSGDEILRRRGRCAMVSAMVLVGVKPGKRPFGEFGPIPAVLVNSGGLQAKKWAERARPTGFEPVTFDFVDRPLVLHTAR